MEDAWELRTAAPSRKYQPMVQEREETVQKHEIGAVVMGTHFCQVLWKAHGPDTTEHTSVHTAAPVASIFMFKSLCMPPCFFEAVFRLPILSIFVCPVHHSCRMATG